MHALALAHAFGRIGVGQAQDGVGPDADRDDDHACTDVVDLSVLLIAHLHTHYGVAVAQQIEHAGASEDVGTEPGCRASHGHGVSGIVDLGVVEAHRAGHLARVEIGREGLGLVLVEALGSRHRAAVGADAAEHVVETNAGGDVGALPALAHGKKERDGAHEVRGQAIEEQATLGERFVHEMELALLEVAQATVGQARGA